MKFRLHDINLSLFCLCPPTPCVCIVFLTPCSICLTAIATSFFKFAAGIASAADWALRNCLVSLRAGPAKRPKKEAERASLISSLLRGTEEEEEEEMALEAPLGEETAEREPLAARKGDFDTLIGEESAEREKEWECVSDRGREWMQRNRKLRGQEDTEGMKRSRRRGQAMVRSRRMRVSGSRVPNKN